MGAVSAIGAGINASFANVRAFLRRARRAWARPSLGLSTSSFRISVLLEEAGVEDAVRRLHAELVAPAEPTAPAV